MGRSKAPSLPIKALSFCHPTELRGKSRAASKGGSSFPTPARAVVRFYHTGGEAAHHNPHSRRLCQTSEPSGRQPCQTSAPQGPLNLFAQLVCKMRKIPDSRFRQIFNNGQDFRYAHVTYDETGHPGRCAKDTENHIAG